MADVTRTITMDEDLWDRIGAAAGDRRRTGFIREAAELRLGLRRLGLPDRLDEIAARLRESEAA